jgi:hypothetical protein
MKYKLTEKGITEARKRSTRAKQIGEILLFGGPYGDYPATKIASLLSVVQHSKHHGSFDSEMLPSKDRQRFEIQMEPLVKKGLLRVVKPPSDLR